ncbi:MAG: hypothetical protein KF851_11685 [Pirellulaceae bacterium]|nr:hypothetical protein [Pirellulaceae bacterium]
MNHLEKQFSIIDLVRAIYRFKFRFVLVTLLCLALGLGFVLLLPKRFESEAKLFVRLGRNSTTIDPATVGQTISIQESRETEINSIIDLLESRRLMEATARDVGQEALLKKYAWSELQLEKLSDLISYDSGSLPSGKSVDDIPDAISKPLESAIQEIAQNLKVISPKKSSTISLVYRARDPELAQLVVTKLIENFQTLHISAMQSQGSVQFFESQLAEQQQILADSENRYREVKTQSQMLTLAGKQGSLQAEYDNVKLMQLQSRAELTASKSRMNELRATLAQLPENLNSQATRGIELSASSSMRDRLYALEIQEKEMTSRNLENHPDLRKVRDQLEEARQIMDAQQRETEQTIESTNPVFLAMQQQLLVEQANVASLSSKLEDLSQQELQISERIAKINSLAVESEELQRKIRIAEDNFYNYSRKLEESRIRAEMDRESLSNVTVVGAPTVRLKHVSPNRPLLAILAGILSLMAAATVAVVSATASNHRKENTKKRRVDSARSIRGPQKKRLASENSEISEETLEEEMALPSGQGHPR